MEVNDKTWQVYLTLKPDEKLEFNKTPNVFLDLEQFSNVVNRSKSQLYFLFKLCDYDFEKLKLLELKIKNCFVCACPGDKEMVDYVLGLPLPKKVSGFEKKEPYKRQYEFYNYPKE